MSKREEYNNIKRDIKLAEQGTLTYIKVDHVDTNIAINNLREQYKNLENCKKAIVEEFLNTSKDHQKNILLFMLKRNDNNIKFFL